MSDVTAGPRLDRLPISPFHWRTLILIGSGMFLDAFELTLAAGVLGALVKEGWSDLAQNARFISTTFAGMLIGAWFAGVFGDRYGRRFCYRVNLLMFGIPSIAAAFAPSMNWLIPARFLMGLGMGAEIVVGFVTLSEFVPPARRGRWGAGLSAVMNSSVFASALVGYLVIPRFGWRWMFAMVGVGALIVWGFRHVLPESPRWLESKGRAPEADKVLRRIEAEASRGLPLPDPVVSVPAPAGNLPLSRLFSRELVGRTVTACTLLVALNTVSFAFAAWLPTFFVKQGYTVVASLGFNMLMSAGAPVGALIGLSLGDRINRKPGIIWSCLAAIVLAAIYPNITEIWLLMVVGFLLITSLYLLSALSFAIYVPELFPTEIRMRGVGLANTAGRGMVVLLPYLVVPIFERTGIGGVVVLIIAFLTTAVVVLSIFGIETRSKPLEELNPLVGASDLDPIVAFAGTRGEPGVVP